ncbi:MAG: putative DNA modification/repair radical SAM protein [Firmicutes bacterium]|nr:putative DNA modification/repair radical SAM protein [Bacillota bacterium]
MDIMEKLKILSDAAKYDVACTSSGIGRAGTKDGLGSAEACGICHSFAADGRCISLLKILQTNVCIYDCQYCANRRSSDVPRAAFTPREVAELTVNFYRRNYIEGLFLSSAVLKSPDHTMEMMCETVRIVREEFRFNGYIHVKAIPGADPDLVRRTGLIADRMSVNIELPSEDSLKRLAPEKSRGGILGSMGYLRDGIAQSKQEVAVYRHAPRFVPAGQATQMIIGATPESDKKIVFLAEGLYKRYRLKRVFYSAYTPTNPLLPASAPPLLREHRLYQADWLLRFYGFAAGEIFTEENENLNLNLDPKCHWALKNLEYFPVEVNRADYWLLMRVPGIGATSASRITQARRTGKLDFTNLKKLGVVLKRAKYFITCDGKMYQKVPMNAEILENRLTENKIGEACEQLSLFDPNPPRPTREDEIKCLTGEI